MRVERLLKRIRPEDGNMKGMSTALKIVITLIVILVVALVILTIFAGGIGNIAVLINSWIHGIQTRPGCIPTGSQCTVIDRCCDAGTICKQEQTTQLFKCLT